MLNTSKILLCFERFQEFFGNVWPVSNITEQTVLVQSSCVKQVSLEFLYISYTLGLQSKLGDDREVPVSITELHYVN